ncbi:MAG: alpha amylase C-terminal domain-containing protein, partial [Clostridia bacterium]|nr:alpha amylase C-terminal domain-containing protein [Clostridia bacterium]
YERELDWLLLDHEAHKKTVDFMQNMNHFYIENPAFWEQDGGWEGFHWLTCDRAADNLIAFCRRAKNGDTVVCIFNFSPVPHENFLVGLPYGGVWTETLCTQGLCNQEIIAKPQPHHGQPFSAEIKVPGLSGLFLSNLR